MELNRFFRYLKCTDTFDIGNILILLILEKYCIAIFDNGTESILSIVRKKNGRIRTHSFGVSWSLHQLASYLEIHPPTQIVA